MKSLKNLTTVLIVAMLCLGISSCTKVYFAPSSLIGSVWNGVSAEAGLNYELNFTSSDKVTITITDKKGTVVQSLPDLAYKYGGLSGNLYIIYNGEIDAKVQGSNHGYFINMRFRDAHIILTRSNGGNNDNNNDTTRTITNSNPVFDVSHNLFRRGIISAPQKTNRLV